MGDLDMNDLICKRDNYMYDIKELLTVSLFKYIVLS